MDIKPLFANDPELKGLPEDQVQELDEKHRMQQLLNNLKSQSQEASANVTNVDLSQQNIPNTLQDIDIPDIEKDSQPVNTQIPQTPMSEADRLQDLLNRVNKQKTIKEGLAQVLGGIDKAATSYAGGELTQLKPNTEYYQDLAKSAEQDAAQQVKEAQLVDATRKAEIQAAKEQLQKTNLSKIYQDLLNNAGVNVPEGVDVSDPAELYKIAQAKHLLTPKGIKEGQSLEDKLSYEKALLKFKHDLDKGTKGEGTTKGQDALDRTFAKEADTWTSGGSKNTQVEIDKLHGVLNDLKNGKVETGMFTGLFPDRLTSNKVLKARSDVESSIMTSLRKILGAQFTENEGTRVIKNTWNEGDSTENNINRIQRLIDTLQNQKETKDAKTSYFLDKGTLAGFQTPEVNPQQSPSSIDVGGTDYVVLQAPNGQTQKIRKDKAQKYIDKGAKIIQD